MPIKPKKFVASVVVDALATMWLEIESIEADLRKQKKAMRKRILKTIRTGNYIPRSKTMKVLVGAALELQGIFPTETVVDPTHVREFIRNYRTLGRLLFERSERFTAKPGAFERHEIRLDAVARKLYHAAIRRRALAPRVKAVRIKKADSIKKAA